MIPNTIGQALRQAVERLTKAGVDIPTRDARLLMAFVLGVEPGRITLMDRDDITFDAAMDFRALIEKRRARIPVSHIVGRRAFYGRDFIVTEDVLDPRPDTESLINAALSAPFELVLDLGTGSGCILLSLLAERPNATGVGTDLSRAALEIAQRNAENLGVDTRCIFEESDWYSAVGGRYDLIVSNPPYIAANEMENLEPELSHEPRMALTDECDGLSAYRAITAEAGMHLTSGGRLMVETGWTQGAVVSELFKDAGLTEVSILPDLDGRDRVVTGTWR